MLDSVLYIESSLRIPVSLKGATLGKMQTFASEIKSKFELLPIHSRHGDAVKTAPPRTRQDTEEETGHKAKTIYPFILSARL